MSDNTLFEPVSLGAIELANRIVMAPMTRSRADTHGCPGSITANYYRQRASAGLIISEGAYPSENGKGYCRTPGIVTDEHIKAWQAVVNAVASEGGKMVMQLMHCGRIASHYNQSPNAETVAPSAIQAKGKMYTDAKGMVAFDEPRALETQEIPQVIEEYRDAAANAFLAGFEGVELHATSGYLQAQFLSTGSNQRTDAYGGSVQNRIRFVVETLEALCSVKGADRVGIRICPGNPFNDLHDDNPEETFTELLKAISPLGLAYLHVIRLPNGPVDNHALAQKYFNGSLILNDSYGLEEAAQTIVSGSAKAISFGRDFIANPDLVERLRAGSELSPFDNHSLYTPGSAGYSDYPAAIGS